MTRENLSVGRLLNTQITPRMSKIEFDNADYIESCMVFKNFTSLDGVRSREFVAKFNHPDEAKDFIKNYNQIYNDHEEQIKAKDEEIKELGEIVQQYLIPSKNYDAIIKAKDEEIRRLNNLYADTIKDLGDALIEIERLKVCLSSIVNLYVKNQGTEHEFITCITPKSAWEMTKKQRKECHIWSVFDTARQILKEQQ